MGDYYFVAKSQWGKLVFQGTLEDILEGYDAGKVSGADIVTTSFGRSYSDLVKSRPLVTWTHLFDLAASRPRPTKVAPEQQTAPLVYSSPETVDRESGMERQGPQEQPGSSIGRPAECMTLGVFGAAFGAIIGFLIRPQVPFIGQLDFGTVVTRGANLNGLDRLLVSAAETSFNYLLFGAVIGGLIGVGIAVVISSGGEEPGPPEALKAHRAAAAGRQDVSASEIAGAIEKLADRRGKGILTTQEFEAKKGQLLGRM